jgi:alpha-L-fucosidase
MYRFQLAFSVRGSIFAYHLTSIMNKLLFLLLLCVLIFTDGANAQTSQNQYQPTWESLNARPYPQWFRDAKLGIFIHWSLSSVPAWSGKEQYGEWFLRGLLTGDSARINFQEKVFGKNWKYEEYAPLFKGEMFDANEWADLFARAGARYVLLVSKHHDGYCLWPSKYSPGWNTMDVGPHRDIVGELTQAVKNQGMKMGLYYSLPEWNNKLYRWGTDKPEMVTRYVDDHMIPQFKELITAYKPSLVFSDGEWDHPASTWHSAELIAWYYNLVGDEAIVNDRWGGGADYGYRTPEYSSGLSMSSRPWAEVRGLGRSFGLNRNESIEAYMTPKDLVHFFVKAVANGGGVTINVGPYCDGQIPLLQQERLLQLGDWLKVNGEAIYASTMYSKATEEKDVELSKIDPEINFDWVRNSPGKPLSEDNFSATWTGYIQPHFSEEYLFEAQADDGIRVWIDGKLIVDKWNSEISGTQSNVMEAGKSLGETGHINLLSGEKHQVKVEYFENKQNAHAYLWWSSASQAKEIVPANCLFSDLTLPNGNGLKAIYKSRATRLCYTVNNGSLYAISLEWPADNKLLLNIEKPNPDTKISILGRVGNLPWEYNNGIVIVDLNPVKIAELPCEWAWVFKISQ